MPSVQQVRTLLQQEKCRQNLKLAIHSHSVLKPRMGAAIPPVMEWYLSNHKDFTFMLALTSILLNDFNVMLIAVIGCGNTNLLSGDNELL